MKIVKVADKIFIGKISCMLRYFRKINERTTYNRFYADGRAESAMRNASMLQALRRDKEYDLTKERRRAGYIIFRQSKWRSRNSKSNIEPNCSQ